MSLVEVKEKKAVIQVTQVGGGAQGPQGIQGPAGANGTNGTNGLDGSDGLSAYEIAVSNGFVGTEAQWLTSLVGPQGPQGIQGPAGADSVGGGGGGLSLFDSMTTRNIHLISASDNYLNTFNTNVTYRNLAGGSVDYPDLDVSNSNLIKRMKRFRLNTSNSNDYNIAQFHSSNKVSYISNESLKGGIKFFARFGLESQPDSGCNIFIGLTSQNNFMDSANISSYPSTIGIFKNASDTNWKVVCRDGSGSLVQTFTPEFPIAVGDVIDFTIDIPTGQRAVNFTLINQTSQISYLENEPVTNVDAIPLNTNLYSAVALVNTTASAKQLAVNKIYFETENW